MKVLIIVAAFLLVQVYGNPINAKCDQQLFTKCTNTFAQALGLPSMPSDATVLDKQIKQFEQAGKQAQVCQAYGNMQSCFGQQFDDCVSVAFLKSIGESDKDAQEFIAMSQQLKIECAHVDAHVINAKCDPTLFTKCTNTFDQGLVKAGRNRTEMCQVYGNYQTCLGQQYDDCMSIAFLKSTGESDASIQVFLFSIQMIKSECQQVQANVINAKCDPTLFAKCANTFAEALYLRGMPPEPWVLEALIKTFEAEGKQGLQELCKAKENLNGCLGAEYSDCMTVAFWKSTGISDKDAQEFVTIFQQLDKTCLQ